MEAVKLSSLKKGVYFTLKPIEEPKESQVFVRDDYDRSERKYTAYKFSDVCAFRSFKGDKLVYIDFYF